MGVERGLLATSLAAQRETLSHQNGTKGNKNARVMCTRTYTTNKPSTGERLHNMSPLTYHYIPRKCKKHWAREQARSQGTTLWRDYLRVWQEWWLKFSIFTVVAIYISTWGGKRHKIIHTQAVYLKIVKKQNKTNKQNYKFSTLINGKVPLPIFWVWYLTKCLAEGSTAFFLVLSCFWDSLIL